MPEQWVGLELWAPVVKSHSIWPLNTSEGNTSTAMGALMLRCMAIECPTMPLGFSSF